MKDALNCIVEMSYMPLPDRGEDAFAYSFERDDVHAQAVFDGCGGAGAWQYPEYENATGAYIAAQSMAKLFVEWINNLKNEVAEPAQSLANAFHEMAEGELRRLKNASSLIGISGSLVKSFPCTASIAILRKQMEGTLDLTALNVGDSRVYILTPDRGLQQVTRDDSRGNPDPLESIRNSPPLSDMLNADRPFEVKHFSAYIKMPCAVICASDGVFSYYRSPMDFEYHLLEWLLSSESFQVFEDSFRNGTADIAGDDATAVISFYGWKDFEDVRSSLKPRQVKLEEMILSIDHREKYDDNPVIDQLWERYRADTLLYEMQV